MLELRRQTDDDQALIAAYRAGDDAAFGRIHERHHAALERYARKVLGRGSEHAEDVVQEAMLRASRALRRDDRHIELRPWLYRLTRNCALDELARVRTDSVNLDDAEDWGVLRAPAATEPDAVVESRGKVRDLLGDLAGLPAQQRHALLRREVDGISHAALADELGVSPQATKNLVHRARTNLVKQREARSSDCEAVRADLLEAHDEGRRASAATYRHLAGCRDCRHFRAGAARHAPRRGDPDADAADGRRLRAADRQGGRGDGEGRDGQVGRHRRGGRRHHRGRGRGRRAGLRPRRAGAAGGEEPRAALRARWPRAASVPGRHRDRAARRSRSRRPLRRADRHAPVPGRHCASPT